MLRPGFSGRIRSLSEIRRMTEGIDVKERRPGAAGTGRHGGLGCTDVCCGMSRVGLSQLAAAGTPRCSVPPAVRQRCAGCALTGRAAVWRKARFTPQCPKTYYQKGHHRFV